MSVRIFSKQAFQFGTGADKLTGDIDCFVTVPGTFQDMPEKYLNDKTFILAEKCGCVSVIKSRESEIAAENSVVTQADNYDPTKSYYDKLKVMDRDSAIEEGKKYGVTYNDSEKLGAFKKRVFEAYKISLND